MMFFFSSRRRHTRSLRDWSSDVCSSDLEAWLAEADYGPQPDHDGDNSKGWRIYNEAWGHVDNLWGAIVAIQPRSEERRVGKGCRSRLAQDHEGKKQRRYNETISAAERQI